MRSNVILFSLSGVILFLALAASIEASSQDNSNKPDETDRIYKNDEVSKKAVIDKRRWELNAPSPSGCEGQVKVVINVVLRKSGKVTNVRVSEPGNCPKFEKRAIKSVEGVKFKPAIRDGVPVSTQMQFEFNLNCGRECP